MSGDYIYERLGPDRFQTLVSSLLVAEYKGFQVYPVGQADGGRDGTVNDGQSQIAFQVKFKRELRKGDNYFTWLSSAIRAELPKISALAAQGASKYIIVTNVPGTAMADAGTMDRVQRFLDENVPIPAQCLWRADLDSRLNGHYDLKWHFSELMATPDVLRDLINEGLGEGRERRESALTAYMKEQYRRDAQVKFKQAELQATDLLNLFVDVPAHVEFITRAERRFAVRPELMRILRDVSKQDSAKPSDGEITARREHHSYSLVTWDRATGDSRRAMTRPLPAASILLHPDAINEFGRTVVEGAPGQGKSTLAQYLCQVHRMRILGRDADLDRIPKQHAISSSRVPFKVDLRDLSLWLDGIDHRRKPTLEKHQQTATLETFLAHEVQTRSGGQEFDASDLYAVAKRLPLLIVLDGFDEVATPKHRAALISEVDTALERLQGDALSIQVIVTSRPSAIPDAPRFDAKQWNYLSLDSIPSQLALKYAAQWGKARRLETDELTDVIGTLTEKLEAPHLRDLARNPMQLTILLTLIHLRGSSLPDQRTALYMSYIEVFFNREAEKTAIVRDHRQLLIDLHAYLAWTMHGDAEESARDGRISTDDLRKAIREFLCAREYPTDIVGALFEGVIHRVVALVSRTEGTFEFEVQPLREYFAAHHLYHTSPYSPPGNPVSGTKPEILQALIANPYWQNVLRFFAGFYSIGEIPGLASEIITSLEDPEMARPSYHRSLALNLLRDWVFHQSPVWTRKVVDAAVDPFTLRLAGEGSLIGRSELSIQLPSECGGPRAAQRALQALPSMPSQFAVLGLIPEITGPLSLSEIEVAWWKWVEDEAATPQQLLILADRLSLMRVFDSDRVSRLGSLWSNETDLELRLCAIGARASFESNELRSQVECRILDSEIGKLEIGTAWQPVALSVRPNYIASLLSDNRQPGSHFPDASAWSVDSRLAAATRVVDRIASENITQFSNSPEPWQDVIDAITSSEEPFLAYLFGAMSAAIVNPKFRGAGARDLWDMSVPLTTRCRHARLRSGDASWWVQQLESCRSETERHKWAALLLTWANGSVKGRLAAELDAALNSMSLTRYGVTLSWFSAISESVSRSRHKVPLGPLVESSIRREFATALVGSEADKRKFLNSVVGSELDLPEIMRDELYFWRVSWLQDDARHKGWGSAVSSLEDSGFLGLKLANVSYFERPYFSNTGEISPEAAREFIDRSLDMPIAALRAADWRLSRAAPETPLAAIARDSCWNVN